MDLSIFCDSQNHPILDVIECWISSINSNVKLITDEKRLTGGKYLLLVSCSQVIKLDVRLGYQYTLVIHASDLPQGRGWSPHIWQILDGKNEITLSLLAAVDKVDTGDIWHQIPISLSRTDLYDDINKKILGAHIDMIKWLIKHNGRVKPYKQLGDASYYPKRSPKDSEIDTESSIASQFNLLRVCDPERYPAFFYHENEKFIIKIERATSNA